MFTGKNAIRRQAERPFDTLTARFPFSGDPGRPFVVCRDAILLTGSTRRRHVAVVVAEDQELLAGAFGQVQHQAIVPPSSNGSPLFEPRDAPLDSELPCSR